MSDDTITRELKSIHSRLDLIHRTQLDHHKDIATLKVKAGMWSAIISAVVAIGAWFIR